MMPASFLASAAKRGLTALVSCYMTSRSCVVSARLDVYDGSSMKVNRELPGPNLDNGTPTKL